VPQSLSPDVEIDKFHVKRFLLGGLIVG